MLLDLVLLCGSRGLPPNTPHHTLFISYYMGDDADSFCEVSFIYAGARHGSSMGPVLNKLDTLSRVLLLYMHTSDLNLIALDSN